MSEDSRCKGKLIPVKIEVDLNTTIHEILLEKDKEFKEVKKENSSRSIHTWYSSLEDLLDGYDNDEKDIFESEVSDYLLYEEVLYKIESKDLDPYDMVAEGNKNQNGEIEFFVHYYNGGCSLPEVLEVVLDKVNKVD